MTKNPCPPILGTGMQAQPDQQGSAPWVPVRWSLLGRQWRGGIPFMSGTRLVSL